MIKKVSPKIQASKTFKFKKQKPKEMFSNLLLWLSKCLTMSNITELRLTEAVLTKIFNIIDSRGNPEAIRYVKELRLKYLEYILSMPPDSFQSDRKIWFPKFFRPIISHIEKSKSYPFIRLVFSALYITRYIKLDPSPSFSTIERAPQKGTPLLDDKDVKMFLKELGINTKRDLGKVPKSLRFKKFHMTSKSGPTGHALWTSFRDAINLSPLQLGAIRVIAGDKLTDLISRLSSLYKRIPLFFEHLTTRKGSTVTRKLIALSDKEGKTREVAIFDYFSQAALLPLHNYLMKRLSFIDQDCTMDQTKRFYEITADAGSSYHSIDLTAFTDRFPISVNHRILSVWFGEEYATAWMQLMVYTPFNYEGRELYYMTGNPMGGYSSWASTSLAHHFLVFLACKKARRNWKKCPYMLLGDDLVIGNDQVALAYKDLLTHWGIDYSVPKTHISPYGFEFAKQIRLHGVNLSPFPLAALYERRNERISTLGIILSEVTAKGWDSHVIHCVKDYYINVLGWSYPRFRAFEPIANLIISLTLYLRGVGDLGTAVKQYVTHSCQIDLGVNDHMYSLFGATVAVKTLCQLFETSRDRIVNPKSGGSLGELATQMVMAITSLRDGGADCFDLIEAVPFLQIYGRAEEKYLELTRLDEDEYKNIPEEALFYIEPSHFKKLFETVDIPLDDKGFYRRHKDVIVLQAMKTARIMTPIILKELAFYPNKRKISKM